MFLSADVPYAFFACTVLRVRAVGSGHELECITFRVGWDASKACFFSQKTAFVRSTQQYTVP